MNRTHGLLILLGVLVLAAAGDLLWLYPALPEQVATKFNSDGVAKAWGTKAGFLAVQILAMLLLIGLALAGRFLVPRLPGNLINMPHRSYWLAPEREQFTRRRIGELVLALCAAQLAFLIALTHLTLRANLQPSPRLGNEPFWLVGGLLGITALLIGRFYWTFRRPR
ncbi:MAG: DUF1648 domain-containing protein [Verrucomicrobia bacterium]|jgi:uncharacterized membrane protein|nr:DUF1648 domain-containing protein [Verrucomicrobiota bacterium]